MAKRRVRGSKRERPVRARKQRRSARKAAVATRTRERTPQAAGIVEEPWAPSPFALWTQRFDDPSGYNPSALLLRHPTAPFVARAPQDDESSLQTIAHDYLQQAKNKCPSLGIPQTWVDALDPQNADPSFGWLPLKWPPDDFTQDNAGDPFVSFRINATSMDGTKLPDDTVVLLATEKLPFFLPAGEIVIRALGSGHGIRVVAHTQKDQNGVEVRITGMSASVPRITLAQAGRSIQDKITSLFQDPGAREALQAEMARSAGLTNSSSMQIRGVRLVEIDGETRFEIRSTAVTTPTQPIPYYYLFLQQEGSLALVSKVELVADATAGNAGVFLTDPASQGGAKDIVKRRPTRSKDALNNYRREEPITNGEKVPLYYPTQAFPEDVVVVCPGFSFEDTGLAQGTPKSVDLPGTANIPEVRSNDFAAISAYWNVEQLFLRLAAYGLNNTTDSHGNPTYPYFRIAKLPLKLRYRAGVPPGRGKDGQTVNARVFVDGWNTSFVGPTPPGDRPEVTIHSALANLSTREREPRQAKVPATPTEAFEDRSPAEPLGIADDPRWMWHEIGHVLLMACVGYLQFPFAHSAGDALAAIVGDAESELARDNTVWRGATFPWVFIPRRHDRSVLQGWSWSGSMHYAAAQVPPAQQLRRKGYWTEQILSSSLFRLYRCIGGDTNGRPDPRYSGARESASHYTVYLIMRGIQIYGTYDVLSRSEPDHLVSALMDADIGTGVWDVLFPDFASKPIQNFTFHRIGGCVHKVIRWAFEAQGMYGPMLRNAPGLPPPVDIYIKDLRPTVDHTAYGNIDYGEGSYMPVPLNHQLNANDPAPLWQADPNAIVVAGNGDISVVVRNRGTNRANGVSVAVWWHTWAVGQPLPDVDVNLPSTSWKLLTAPGNPPAQSIDAGKKKTFAVPRVPPAAGNSYLLFAQATCADDPANTDPTTGLPCSQQSTPLVDLVANDNNLGLRVVVTPARAHAIRAKRAIRPGRA
jgi:hypothetical protein